MKTIKVPTPTAIQCTAHVKVYESAEKVGYAIWYPQMGGYVGKAVAVMDKEWGQRPDLGRVGGCVDLLVWHDGKFPFYDRNKNPTEIHLCDPGQFIAFGEALVQLNNRGKTLAMPRNQEPLPQDVLAFYFDDNGRSVKVLSPGSQALIATLKKAQDLDGKIFWYLAHGDIAEASWMTQIEEKIQRLNTKEIQP